MWVRQRTTIQQVKCHLKVSDAMERIGVVEQHNQLRIVVAGAASFDHVSVNKRFRWPAVSAETLFAMVTARKQLFVTSIQAPND